MHLWLRRAGARAGLGDGQGGAVTVVQRFVGALNLNVHFWSSSTCWYPCRARTCSAITARWRCTRGCALIVPRGSAGAEAEGLTGVLDGLFCG
jgi:hypothetical protein